MLERLGGVICVALAYAVIYPLIFGFFWKKNLPSRGTVSNIFSMGMCLLIIEGCLDGSLSWPNFLSACSILMLFAIGFTAFVASVDLSLSGRPRLKLCIVLLAIAMALIMPTKVFANLALGLAVAVAGVDIGRRILQN